MQVEPFASSFEHIGAELERLDLLIRAQVERVRQAQPADLELQGLYIAEQEIDRLLARPGGLARDSSRDTAFVGLAAELDRTCSDLARRKAESIRRGIVLRLEALAHLFQLTPFDVDVLLLGLAPEIDLHYERLYAYLQDDVTKKRPSVSLSLDLLCSSRHAAFESRHRFDACAPLLIHQLLNLLDDPAFPHPPLIGRFIKLDDRIVDYLLDSDALDARLLHCVQMIVPRHHLEDMLLPAPLRRTLAQLARDPEVDARGLVLYLHGPYGVGKQTTAEALARERGMKLLVVDLNALANADQAAFELVTRLAKREARLQGAALYWQAFDSLLGADKTVWRTHLLRLEEIQPGLTFLSGDQVWEPRDSLRELPFVRVEFRRPPHVERTQLWARFLDGGLPPEAAGHIGQLATKFHFSGGQIQDAVATARNLARARDPENARVTPEDLYAACRLQSNGQLATLAKKIEPHYDWNDIILPADRLEQLREICNHVKYRALVYDQWEFDQKLALGKGLNILFAGPSGTGKTMAADILAGALGLDLYKIDLSAVVSKYIGETEKNLARIFAEAETSNAILFFDEADALFGKRSQVRDSHDRYANVEIAYLLQKMEEYAGVVILATNLRANMDDAFVRRMHFTIEFPFPGEADRRRIWEHIFPQATPRSADVDLDFMARRFEIAGGNIRNIALAAAFLAADDGAVVGMVHLIRATRREFQKMGKVLVDGEFGEYARLAAPKGGSF